MSEHGSVAAAEAHVFEKPSNRAAGRTQQSWHLCQQDGAVRLQPEDGKKHVQLEVLQKNSRCSLCNGFGNANGQERDMQTKQTN